MTGAGITDDFRRHVSETVPEFLPGFESARVVDGWSGVDAGTPDARAILDAPDDGPDGLVVATGFNGIGMVYSPTAAAAVRSLVTGGECPFALKPFALDRFESGSLDFDLFGTFEAAGV